MITRFAPRRRLQQATTWLWHWLRRPWLAVFAGIIGVTLSLAVWRLPQLPGQLVDEHAAAANWLLNTSTAYGIWGNPFLALGLFNVLRSPLLYLLLALLVPTLAAQLADQLGALWQQRSAFRIDLSAPAQQPGHPLKISAARPIYRWRGMVQADTAQLANTLTQHLAETFPHLEHAQAPLAAALPGADDSDDAAPRATETRVRALRRPRLHYLRPLLMIGMLLAIGGAWVALAFGWQVTAPPLAPGGVYRSANRDLVLQYQVPTTPTLPSTLDAALGDDHVTLPADQSSRRTLGAATIQARPDYPAIWIVAADGNARLSLPGEAQMRAKVGLVLVDPGDEESILIPDQGAGLRVVRRTDNNGFVLELYRSDTILPVYRADLTPGGQLNLPFGPLDPGLIITALPGLQVDVRHLPGLLLVPLGIVLACIGAVAFLRSSAFVLVQVAPWSHDRAVVVLQSDQPDLVKEVRAIALEDMAPAQRQTDESALPQPQTAE